MSIVKSLNRLKNNIFGGPGNTGFSKPPAYKTRIKMQETPVGLLDDDPLRFGTYQFPKDIYHGGQIGHYMIFYVNVMNRTDYAYGDDVINSEQEYQREVAVQQKLEGTSDFGFPIEKIKRKVIKVEKQ